MATRVELRLEGWEEARDALEKAARNAGGIPGAGLRLAGELIMADVKASRPGAGVPRDTGNLAASGRVVAEVEGGRVAEVRLVFGGTAAPYALVQHERLDYHHPLGEARYLVRGAERFAASGPGGVDRALDAVLEAATQVLAAAQGAKKHGRGG